MRKQRQTHRSAGRLSRRPAIFVVALVLASMLLAACADEQTVSNPGSGAGAATERVTTAPPPRTDTEQAGDEPSKTGSGAPDAQNEKLTVTLNEDVVAAHNRFGVLVFRHLLGQQLNQLGQADGSGDGDDTNVFLSPTSIALALGMALNGAAGETESAMAAAMQLAELRDGGLTRDDINAAHLAMVEALTGADVRLDIANSIWYREELAFNPDFLRDNERYYRALVSRLDFAAPESVSIINDWVSEATQGLIPSVIDQLNEDQIMMLINAVYFKGDWTTPFNAQLTRELPFRSLGGGTRPVPMMYRDGRIDYYENDFQAVRLPYGEDERIAMYVFLPPADEDFGAFVERLTDEALAEAFDQFAPAQGEVLLPRMDIAYKSKLNEALEALGMGVAFDANAADFSRMRPAGENRKIYIGDVVHQSVLKVDEEGTEAAGVTSVEFRVTSLPVYDFRFQADRPFIVIIRDDATGAMLFVGAITDPGSQGRAL